MQGFLHRLVVSTIARRNRSEPICRGWKLTKYHYVVRSSDRKTTLRCSAGKENLQKKKPGTAGLFFGQSFSIKSLADHLASFAI
jgi:hypothetical protein